MDEDMRGAFCIYTSLNLHVMQVVLSILFHFMCEMAKEAPNIFEREHQSSVTPIYE